MMIRNMTNLRGRGKLTSSLLVAIAIAVTTIMLLGMMISINDDKDGATFVVGSVSSHLPASISFRWNNVWGQATLKLYNTDKENQKEGEEESEENKNELNQKLLLDSLDSTSTSSSFTVSFIETEMSKHGSNINLDDDDDDDDDDDNGSTAKDVVEEEKNLSSGENQVQMEEKEKKEKEKEEKENDYYDNDDYSSGTIGESIEDDNKTTQDYRGRRQLFQNLRKTLSSSSIGSSDNEVGEDGTFDSVVDSSAISSKNVKLHNKNNMNNKKDNSKKKEEKETEEDNNNKKSATEGNLRVSSSSSSSFITTTNSISTSLLVPKGKKNVPNPRFFKSYKRDDDDDDDVFSSFAYHNVEKGTSNKPNRLLQTSGSTTKNTTSPSSPICSNVSDTFQTSYAIIFVGDTSLVTPEKANLLAATFAKSYNDERSGSNNNNTNKCDPLFRTISEVRVITNASLTGTNNAGEGEGLLENSIGIIPVRRKLQRQQHLRDDSNWMDGILWESLLKFNQIKNYGGEAVSIGHYSKHERYRRQLQQQQLQKQQQQQQQESPQLPLTSGLNGTIANYDVGLLLLDIFGTCRGCQGNSIRFELFDDTTTSITQQQQQQQQQRYLEEDSVTDDDDDDCSCPTDAVATDLTSFQLSFNSKIEDLRDSEELDFVEQLDEIIPISDDECPTKEQDFSFVYLVTDVVFSRDIFLSLGVEGVKEIQILFEDSYNRVAQQLCDPLYRAISRAQLVSIEQEEKEGSSTVQIEFVVEATCRGDNCINVGCIFDDVDSCGKNPQRERNLKTNIGSHQHQPMSESKDGIVPVNSIDTSNIIKKPPRILQEEQKKKDDEKEERCFCRKGRSIRPPTPTEVRLAFQDGLDRITKKNKLSSCQQCSFSTDCQSGVCSPAGRCAEADTQLLLNSCICSSNVECESGFCQQQEASSSSATCQGKLASCRVCNNGDECLSGFCTGGRCAEAIDGKLKTGCDCTTNVNCQSGRCGDDFLSIGGLGKCTEKISDTCTVPCLSSNDCNSGLCGSIVCMPPNGTLLAEGCLAAFTTECKSGASLNNICTKRKSPAPSFQPSQEPSTTAPSDGREPTSQPTAPPTTPPTPLPTTAPPTSPLTPGPAGSPTSPPTPDPTESPTFPPTPSPTESPTFPPTPDPTESPTFPPTPSPTESPTSPPSPNPTPSPTSPPTPSPTESPTSPPTTSFPSVSPSTSFPSTSPPTVLEDCRTFPANEYTMDDVYSFCNAHIGQECCSEGPQSCSSWNRVSSTYTVCKMACTGPDACTNLGGGVEIQRTIILQRNSCVKDKACINLGQNNGGANVGGTIDIGPGSCFEADSCNGLGVNAGGDIIIGSESCSSFGACRRLGIDVTGDITIGTGSCTGKDSCNGYGKSASSINVADGCDADDVLCNILG